MKDILQQTKAQLSVPNVEARRKLLIILNWLYIFCSIIFLVSEKISTGYFVPRIELFYFVYLPAFISNFLSAIYNRYALRAERGKFNVENSRFGQTYKSHGPTLDSFSAWLSLVSILFMSFMNMIGFGNPSQDAILTDFAFGHSLIIVAVILLGRKAAIIWFVIVLGCLFFNVFLERGVNYQYHYLTPDEVIAYEKGLTEGDPVAIERKETLIQNSLNPPKITRYFNTWIIFIVTSFFCAYYFSGITIDILKILPPVVDNIETAIQNNLKIEMELNRKQVETASSAARIVRVNEILEMINTEFDMLDHKDKEKFRHIIHIIRQEMNREKDWEVFKINFDNLHSGFFKYLEIHFNLTDIEQKHLAYIRMSMDNDEIAQLMDVKKESLRTLRSRLKKKLNLDKNDDLKIFVKNIKLES